MNSPKHMAVQSVCRTASGATVLEVILILTIAILGSLCALMLFRGAGVFRNSQLDFRSTGPTVTQLESLAELVPLRVYVADVLEAEGESYRGSWLVKGDAIISVSLKGARIVERNDEKQTACISLPPPRVLQARVDHERTKTWDVRKNTWVPFVGNPDRLRDAAMQHAQKLVEEAAREDQNMDYARKTAALVLKSMYRLNGWEVDVQWADQATK